MRYWNIEDYPEILDARYSFIVGMRSNGKSYSVKNYLVKQAVEHGKKFMLLRKYITEKIDMSTYFDDIPCSDKIKCIDNSYLYDGKIIGYSRSISQYKRIKSSVWNDVEYIVYEEFLSLDEYEEDEYSKFINIVSSVFRQRNGHVICIGNLEKYSQVYTSALLSKFAFDLDELIQGKTIYSNFNFDVENGKNYSICLHWCENCYDSIDEIPEMMRLPMNDIATSGNVDNYDSDVFECEYTSMMGCIAVFPSENSGKCYCMFKVETEYSEYYDTDTYFVKIVEMDINSVPEHVKYGKKHRNSDKYDMLIRLFIIGKKSIDEINEISSMSYIKYADAKSKAILQYFVAMKYDTYIKSAISYSRKLFDY